MTEVADFDSLPYASMPFSTSRPTHTGAVARLFGLQPADPSRARVLEIACASGGNLIPLAVQAPEGRFVGIDLATRHVREGQETVAALGLDNVEIWQADVAEADFGEATFDYIICHGVYSWVPEAARAAILAIAGRHLAPDGVLYVSYNIYPGWHLRTIVRDICLYHAGAEGTPQHRVARARWALQRIAEGQTGQSPYAAALRQEADLTRRHPDSYILGEFLAAENAPCYFKDFVARADAAGLSYLSETRPGSSLPESLPGETGALVRRIAGQDGVALEQYIDFFGGRTFRRSLLMRRDQAGRINRALNPGGLMDLHLAAPWREIDPDTAGGPPRFSDGKDSFTARNADEAQLLRVLHAAWPDSLTPTEILQRLVAKGVVRAEAEAKRAMAAMMSLVLAGRVEITTTPVRLGRADDTRPKIWPVARHQLATGQTVLTSQRHEARSVSESVVPAMRLVDGTRNRAALIAALQTVPRTDAAPLSPSEAADGVDQMLTWLETQGFLVATSG